MRNILTALWTTRQDKSHLKLIDIGLKKQLPCDEFQNNIHIDKGVTWILNAQSQNNDGGIPAKYSLKQFPSSFFPSYPETSGYILSTLINYQQFYKKDLRKPINSLVNFLLKTQLDCGGFRGGHEKMKNFNTPSIFNSGQILIGLSYYAKKKTPTTALETAIKKCINWLDSQLLSDGSYNPKFSFTGTRTYYTHATYGLLLASHLYPQKDTLAKAKKNIVWTIEQQLDSGWIENWSFDKYYANLHCIAYTLRGILEAAIIFENNKWLNHIEKSLGTLLKYKVSWGNNYLLPSNYRYNWQSHDDHVCPTGLAQLSIVLWKFSEVTGQHKYKEISQTINSYTRQLQLNNIGSNFIEGGISGSWPLYGYYQSFDIINWGVKFFIDSLLLEEGLSSKEVH